jgi:hypothetical protein
MKCCVEIEFAANLDKPSHKTSTFHVLQIRPISTDSLSSEVDWNKIDDSDAFLRSACALGTGWVKDVRDIVYVPEDRFDKMQTTEIAAEVATLNSKMREEGRSYVLIGYGRWGTSVPSLGIPVKWSDISEVKALVECVLPNFRIDPSQGTHFFQNLTSFGVGYFTINTFTGDGILQKELLDQMPAVEETEFVRHVRFDRPLKIMMDGKKQHGVVLLPDDNA